MQIKKKEKTPMSKCIVSTTGRFGLLNTNGEYVESNRPTVTVMTTFIESRLANNELFVHARNLPLEADDAEFKKMYKEAKKADPEDIQKAVNTTVAAFCALFGQDIDGNKMDVEVESPEVKKEREKAEEKARAGAEKKAQEDADAKKAEEDARVKAAEDDRIKMLEDAAGKNEDQE